MSFNLLRLKKKPEGTVITYVRSDFEEDSLKLLGENVSALSASEEYSVFSLMRDGRELFLVGTGSGGPSVLSALFEIKTTRLSALVRIGACGGLNRAKVGEAIVCNSSFCSDRVSSILAGGSQVLPDRRLTTELYNEILARQIPVRIGSNVSVDAMYLFESTVAQGEGANAVCWDLETSTVLAFGYKFGIRSASVLQAVSDRDGESSQSYPPLRRLDYVEAVMDVIAHR